jgi:catechol 2,3-dioxygenase-like lactoylglutathione lyase family enzyme
MAAAFDLDHFVLVVRDVERSLAWYQQHLGLGEVRLEEWRRGEVPFPSLRVNQHTIIDFIPGDPNERGHLDHICFVATAADVEALKEQLDVVDEGERFGARGIAHSIYVQDPDGLTVEVRAYPDWPPYDG